MTHRSAAPTRTDPRASARRTHALRRRLPLRKQVLVSVDRGRPASRCSRRPASRPPRARAVGASRQNPAAGYRVAELYIERRGARSIVGNIYKGQVDNVLPGLEAAFVDIGLEKNGFLHVDEIVLPGVEVPRRGAAAGARITDLLKPGQEIVVQVVKDPLKTKGARLSMELTIAGRYLVYAPQRRGRRRLAPARRQGARPRCARRPQGLDLGGGGAIIRTAAARRQARRLRARAASTCTSSTRCCRSASRRPRPRRWSSRRPTCRCASCATSSRTTSSARSSTTPSSTTAWSRSSPARRPSWSTGSSSTRTTTAAVRALRRRDEVIDGVLSRRVDLPSGGYLIIDYAEALTVIDVNSGSFTGRGKGARLEDTITKTNLEAAEEVVRQLRLRDIGGIIVIDFIDMARARNRDAVLKTLRKALDEDRTKTFVVEISPLGPGRDDAPERHRRRARDHDPAVPDLRRRGRDQVRGDDRDRVRAPAARAGQGAAEARGVPDPDEPARVGASSPATAARMLHALEEETGKRFHFEGSEGLPLDHFAWSWRARATRSRSARCRSARATRCSSTSSSRTCTPRTTPSPRSTATSSRSPAAARYVGEKRLVRIEEVGRTSASAVLVGCRERRRRASDESDDVFPAPGPQRRTAPFPCNGRILMTYAIVKTGGKQYRVEEGQSLLVERLPEDEGAKVALEPLLYRRRRR